jgi:enoyl-[acyl-carrier protein] reductase I
VATRAASGIPEFDEMLDKVKRTAPSRELVSIDDVGIATTFLAHMPRASSPGRSCS